MLHRWFTVESNTKAKIWALEPRRRERGEGVGEVVVIGRGQGVRERQRLRRGSEHMS